MTWMLCSGEIVISKAYFWYAESLRTDMYH